MLMLHKNRDCSFDEELYGCNRRIILVEKVTKELLQQKTLKILHKRLNTMMNDLSEFMHWKTTIEKSKIEDDSYVVDVTFQPKCLTQMIEVDVNILPIHTMKMDDLEDNFKNDE